jgi:tetratricopeptide (TPR) repeat protein
MSENLNRTERDQPQQDDYEDDLQVGTGNYDDNPDDLDDDEYEDDEETEYDLDDGSDYEDEDDDATYTPQNQQDQMQTLMDQLMTSPMFAQVQQLFGGMSGIEQQFTQAQMKMATGDPQGAAEIYLDMLDEEPDNYRANESLGQALMMLDKPDQAEIYLKKATEIEPETASAYLYLGYAYFYQEKYPECISALEKCTELDPSSHISMNNLGFAYYLNNELDKAAQTFARAGDLGSERAYYNLGMVMLLLDDEETAAQAYDEALALDPDARQVQDHINDLAKAIAAFPDRAEALQAQIEELRDLE